MVSKQNQIYFNFRTIFHYSLYKYENELSFSMKYPYVARHVINMSCNSYSWPCPLKNVLHCMSLRLVSVCKLRMRFWYFSTIVRVKKPQGGIPLTQIINQNVLNIVKFPNFFRLIKILYLMKLFIRGLPSISSMSARLSGRLASWFSLLPNSWLSPPFSLLNSWYSARPNDTTLRRAMALSLRDIPATALPLDHWLCGACYHSGLPYQSEQPPRLPLSSWVTAPLPTPGSLFLSGLKSYDHKLSKLLRSVLNLC